MIKFTGENTFSYFTMNETNDNSFFVVVDH